MFELLNKMFKRKLDQTLKELTFIFKQIQRPSEICNYYNQLLSCYVCKQTKSVKCFYFNHRNTGRCQRSSDCIDCNTTNRIYRRTTVKGFLAQMIKSCQSSAKKRLQKGRTDCGVCNITKKDILRMKMA